MAKRQFKLSADEVAELTSAYNQTKDSIFSRRLLAVRLYGTGRATEEIRDLVSCGRTSLMEWVEKYQKQGIEGLRDQRQGGNNFKLTIPQREEISRLLHSYAPKQLLGQSTATESGLFWTTEDLKQLLKERYNVVYKNAASYRKLFVESGFSYQRTEKKYKSKSARKHADFEEKLEKN